MTPRERKVHRWVTQWQERWLLQHYEIAIIFEDGKSPERDWSWATCSADPKYIIATIHIWSPFWTEAKSDADREGVIVHELAHILTWDLAALATRGGRGMLVTQSELDRADEQATEHIAKALFRAYR